MKFRKGGIFIAIFAALSLAGGAAIAQKSSLKPDAATDNGMHEAPSPTAPKPDVTPDYIIGPDDVLAVNVWKEPDLSRLVLVRPDGKITLPLLKDIDASGNTPGQLQARIETALSDYVSKPAVTVIVQEAKSHKFNILGAVQKPGSYVITGPLTVLDAIALAGGLREWAKRGSIYILRETSPGNREKIPFDYKKVVKGSRADVLLKIKDTIVVP
jgi:polysaccharide biosynthesis/export protein